MVKKEEAGSSSPAKGKGNESVLLTKPGQRYPTPTPGVAERIFYETLYHQRPDSAMAQEWVVAYGILEEDVAAKIHKLVQARKASGKPGTMWSPSPGKGASSNGNGNGKKKAGAAAAKGKRKMRLDDDIPVDTGLAEAGDEGMGTLGFS